MQNKLAMFIVYNSDKLVNINAEILAQSSANFCAFIQFSGHSYIGRIARSFLR